MASEIWGGALPDLDLDQVAGGATRCVECKKFNGQHKDDCSYNPANKANENPDTAAPPPVSIPGDGAPKPITGGKLGAI